MHAIKKEELFTDIKNLKEVIFSRSDHFISFNFH